MRAELWHWLKAGTRFEGGVKFTPAVFEAMLAECYNAFKSREGRFKDAAKLLKAMVTAKDLPPDLFALTWKKLA
jgi:malate synthase